MLRSELLEREAEARRLELAQTFDELRARATPGHMLDQLVDYASASGGADLFRNLRDQTVANPLALALVGAGLAWLMMSGRRGSGLGAYRGYDYYDEMEPPRGGGMRRYFESTRERAGDALSGARHFVSDTAAGVRQRVSGAAHFVGDAAGSTADMVGGAAGSIASTARSARDAAFGTASSLGERAGDTTAAVGGAASALYGGVAHSAGRTASGVRALASGTAATSRDMFDFARDQPLVLAGLGLAFGAAMGAAFPATETERELMGEASDELKERTQAFVAENYDKSRSAAEAAYDEFQHRGREGATSLSGHTGLAPLDEEETTEIPGTTRPERIGPRDLDGRS
jgi:hypothetical protein